MANPRLRVVHTATGIGSLDFLRNGQLDIDGNATDYLYGSQYHDVGSGSNLLSLTRGNITTEFGKSTFDASRGHKYTAAAVINVSGVDLVIIDDPFNKSLVSDNARLRVFNSAPNVRQVDTYLSAAGRNWITDPATFSATGFAAASPASGEGSLELERGTYQLRLTEPGSRTVLFSATLELPKNADWTLFLLAESEAALLAGQKKLRVLLLRSDDSADATDDLVNQPLP